MPASMWLLLPRVVCYGAGLSGACSILLAMAKLGMLGLVTTWWAVFLPVLIALTFIWLIFLAAVVLWVAVAVRLLTCPEDVEHDTDTFNLDSLFRTAKVCLIGHAYSILLCIAMWLFVFKVEGWSSLSMAYPCMPFVVLGTLHVLVAILFKFPELNAGRSSFIGVSMLGHSVMLILEIDNHLKASLPWSVVFIPSWFTYLGVFVACTFHGAYSLGNRVRGGKPMELTEAWLLVGAVCWALGFCCSQFLLALHLDGGLQLKHWELALVPALVGWCVLVVCAALPVSRYFEGVIQTFLDFCGIEADDEDDPKEPLLMSPEDGLPATNWR